MNEKRFKELLNLHLDHCLSAEEAAELDAALRADPRRVRMLREYEAMQGACASLFARAVAQAPSSHALRRALRQAESRIERGGQTRESWGWATWAVSGGLAACVALVVARVSVPAWQVASAGVESAAAMKAAENEPGVPSGVSLRMERVAAQASGRGELPSQITFAALGIQASTANADAASRWILREAETSAYVLGDSPSLSRSVMQAESEPVSWGTYPSAMTFGSRPGAAFSGSGSLQAENAVYRFER